MIVIASRRQERLDKIMITNTMSLAISAESGVDNTVIARDLDVPGFEVMRAKGVAVCQKFKGLVECCFFRT